MTSCSNLKDVWEGKRFEVEISLCKISGMG